MTIAQRASYTLRFTVCAAIIGTGLLFDSGRETDSAGRTIWNYSTYGEQHTPDHWCADGEHPNPRAPRTLGYCHLPNPTQEGNTP
jgi:hypothetical protein